MSFGRYNSNRGHNFYNSRSSSRSDHGAFRGTRSRSGRRSRSKSNRGNSGWNHRSASRSSSANRRRYY